MKHLSLKNDLLYWSRCQVVICYCRLQPATRQYSHYRLYHQVNDNGLLSRCRQRARLCYFSILHVILLLKCSFNKTPKSCIYTPSGALIMLVSVVVPEKLPGQKRCDEEDDDNCEF